MRKKLEELNLLFGDDNYETVFEVEDKGFAKIFKEVPFIMAAEKMNGSDVAIFLLMAEYTNYNYNIAKHKNGKPIRRMHISNMLNMHKVTVHNSVTKLIDLGFIAEIKANGETCFVVNPYLSRKSPEVSKQIVDLFKGKINFAKYLSTE